MPFVSDQPLSSGQQLVWNWQIRWDVFSQDGTVSTSANQWDASVALGNLGGLLTVKVSGPGGTDSITVNIAGTNPSAGQVVAYLAAKADSGGFDKILQHESKMRHFDARGAPVKSFDNGYGMCQMTNPRPTYEQCWNWQMNVDCGLALFAAKRQAAIRYLSQNGRTFTEDQASREAIARWNGGSYHVWDGTKNAWVRNPVILCDTKTGNIGWDITKPSNQGQNEAALHARDAAKYAHRPGANDAWGYFGVCYADQILS
jgi:hypothetical protein